MPLTRVISNLLAFPFIFCFIISCQFPLVITFLKILQSFPLLPRAGAFSSPFSWVNSPACIKISLFYWMNRFNVFLLLCFGVNQNILQAIVSVNTFLFFSYNQQKISSVKFPRKKRRSEALRPLHVPALHLACRIKSGDELGRCRHEGGDFFTPQVCALPSTTGGWPLRIRVYVFSILFSFLIVFWGKRPFQQHRKNAPRCRMTGDGAWRITT